jgi:hypothetical protein
MVEHRAGASKNSARGVAKPGDGVLPAKNLGLKSRAPLKCGKRGLSPIPSE